MKLRLLIVLFIASLQLMNGNEKREEIKAEMWSSANKAFTNTTIPEKWNNSSAVILAQLNRFEYRKPALIKELQANSYYHVRIKLNDKNALNEYSEISFPSERRALSVYTGFKLIKSDGRELVIDHSKAVEMEMKNGGRTRAYKKLAIPNLEEGDILDYYICEEETLPLSSNMYYFSPVQYDLPQQYPVIEQRLEFKAQRRCFISMNAVNGAPELQQEVDENTDDVTYYLIDKNREGIKDTRWFYPYRELPTIKFRAAYASGKAVRNNDVLLGEPGVVKSEVTEKELTDFLTYIFVNTYSDPKSMIKHVKKNVDKHASNFEKAKAGFYFRRNEELTWEEVHTIADKDTWNQSLAIYKDNAFQSLDRFAVFLAQQDIPHDIVFAVPRDVASIDDVLLEHELKYLIRVKQGDEFLYLSPVDNFRMPGEFDDDLMGTEAYIVDGNANFADWKIEKITLPVISKDDNKETSTLDVILSNDFKSATIDIHSTLSGSQKTYAQYSLLDIYDYKKEESAKFEMKQDFEGTLWMKKKLLGLRESYLKTKEQYRNQTLKAITDNSYDFEIDTVSDFKLLQSGRFDTLPEMKYQYTFETKELVNKAGRNYMLNIGKLIQNQTKIDKEELERQQGIYQYSPRAYSYTICVTIPEGYTVQGVDKLNTKIENEQGAFITTAKLEGNQLIVTSEKFYNNIYDKAEAWPNYVAFLNAAATFTESKVLLRKQ
ncbi:hypothetical protein [Carboxylicivirga marina]|uniref:hypothetical protein n=1 Tax=Carboxylicivirga marina TaxID=2800988 RepID=UPI0025923E85|nr:hypothetical protein [uncultured Carboxylicivirga sp.]